MVDFDLLNNAMPAENHVTASFGRDFGDVTPLRGVILGGGAHHHFALRSTWCASKTAEPPGEPQRPQLRIEACNDAPVRGDGAYVLYWMIATRSASYNFALDRALECARELGKPLVVFEALRSGYAWASDRLHRFVIEGMVDNAREFKAAGITYYPNVEGADGEGKGLSKRSPSAPRWSSPTNFPASSCRAWWPRRRESSPSDWSRSTPMASCPFARPNWSSPPPMHFAASCNVHSPRTSPSARVPARSRKASSSLPRSPKIVARWPHTKLPELLAPSGLALLPIDHGVQSTPSAREER